MSADALTASETAPAPGSAPVSAPRTWEYMEISRKTETYLVGDLNDLGKEGWELVTVLFRRDIKMGESYYWTAFVKRLCTDRPPSKPVGEQAAAQGAAAEEEEVFEIFEVAAEETEEAGPPPLPG
jgi:hypothetical protein